MNVQYICSDDERRAAVLGSALNGIDYLEVLDRDSTVEEMRQRLLIVRMLHPLAAALGPQHVRITGGVRITPIGIDWAMPLGDVAGADPALVPATHAGAIAAHFAAEPDPQRVFLVYTDSEGDYSTYTFALVDPSDPGTPPTGFDPRLSAVPFSFKVECPSDFDCRVEEVCPPELMEEPRLNYLAKDYASFRRVMLDRLSAIAPAWQERSPADFGIAMVELLAYVGDRLSYFQDAVATEAYLGTARRRVSVRRHARLVDYRMHEGANARTWVHLRVGAGADGALIPARTVLSTAGNERITTRDPSDVEAVQREGGIFFETMHAVTPRMALNDIPFHTWTDLGCCLPKGATRATLRSDPIPGLQSGSVLLFEEVLGPATGAAADADPLHRHVVRLTEVETGTDPLDSTAIIEIAWSAEDALPFALCLSATTDDAHGAVFLPEVSLARGNLVLADHGLDVSGEAVGTVPDDPRLFRPALAGAPVTHAAPLAKDFPDEASPSSATALMQYAPREAVPWVRLTSSDGEDWDPMPDLLASDRFKREFVLEVDQDSARIRTGDDLNGLAPEPGLTFTANYRVGNGRAGNVGAQAISQIFTTQGGIETVRNPIAAQGGIDPEALEEVRRYAPQAFRQQLRAVTEKDYADAAEKHPEVQRAAATFRWTGSWYTVFVTIDRRGGLPVDADFETRMRQHLSFYRMAGYDLEIDPPRFVPLEISLLVCVKPGFQRSAVKQAVLDVLSCRVRGDGSKGLFHPDNWTFAQPVYLSEIVATAAKVTGVASVDPLVFKRWDRDAAGELDDGVLTTERLEIARLDNDPSAQENGLITLKMGGGR
ncbi:MAG: putative baseplate assembly protein [Rhodobacteraceae bacterium]|nr:putative baseplate assembly protein [Paracoccaceae bacterium]